MCGSRLAEFSFRPEGMKADLLLAPISCSSPPPVSGSWGGGRINGCNGLAYKSTRSWLGWLLNLYIGKVRSVQSSSSDSDLRVAARIFR